MWLFIQQHTSLFTKEQVLLHVAPERFYFDRFREDPRVRYTAIDLFAPGYTYPEGTINMDITRLEFPDATFDAVICSHVLEHVHDDRLAMRELRRVLKPGGWAIIQVPRRKGLEHTDEDITITDPQERFRRFGQADHFRIYGTDLKERLSGAGFAVEVVPFSQSFTPAERFRYGLPNAEDVYFCSNPAQ